MVPRAYQWYHWLTNGTSCTIGRANATIGITIGTNGITNGTIGKTLNDIGTPLVPFGNPERTLGNVWVTGHFGPFLIAHNTALYVERVILLLSECPMGALLLVGGSPQPDSDQAVDGMRHVGFRVLLVLFHCLCYKNDVILNDQSNIKLVVSILRTEFQALSLTK